MVNPNNQGQNQWKIGMFWTPCERPCPFLYNCMCAPCALYTQREKLLGDRPYICCMGACPILCFGSECDKTPWLCLEVCCCTPCAVSANRVYIQNMKQLENSFCDSCLIWATCICQCAICISEMMGEPVDPSIKNMVDLFYYIVIGCMITQQDLEIDADYKPPQSQVMA